MIRAFETHRIRRVEDLGGLWDFTVDGAETRPYRLTVPGCWESHPDLVTYRGQGRYQRNLLVDQETNLWFDFAGVSHTARVFIDGQCLGEHHNAYTAFQVLAPRVAPGVHRLEVWVNNAYDGTSALHVPNDYYTYGGLIRGVEVHHLGNLAIESVTVVPQGIPGRWEAAVEVAVVNHSEGRLDADLVWEGAGARHRWSGPWEPGRQLVTARVACPQAPTWSPAAPNLVLTRTQLWQGGRAVDDRFERVGFRTVTIEGSRLWLNGDPLRLVGFNRHEDHPTFGAALPLALQVKDLDLIQGTGANAVRTSHYPADELFLDLCDERGLCVWEEHHFRGLSLAQMQHPRFAEQAAAVNREMVSRHRNHPSIVVWGLLNEGASHTPEGRRLYEAQFAQIRSLDPSRPVTAATCHHDDDLCWDLSDIASVNLYAGWYEDIAAEAKLAQVRRAIDAGGGRGRPIIVSEFGADGFYGYRDPSRVRGTEERQAQILIENLMAYARDPDVVGLFVWQFCDIRTHDGDGWFVTRARTKNNKGVVDEYRRPKLAYEALTRAFAEVRR